MSAADRTRVPPLRRLGSILLAPLAPLYGVLLAFFMHHPPRHRRGRGPADYGLPAADMWLTAPDGVRLHCWLCPGDPTRVVVLGHGLGLSKGAGLAHAKFLHDAGYTVCLFDHRNHGRSESDWTFWRSHWRHTDDVLAVVRHLRSRPRLADARYAVYGFSISTYTILRAVSLLGGAVGAVVCDSGPALDLRVMTRTTLRSGMIRTPRVFQVAPAAGALRWAFQRAVLAMIGFGPDWPPMRPPVLRTTPILFMSGGADAIMPVREVMATARHFPRAEVHVLPTGAHLRGLRTDEAAYTRRVLDFLKHALS